MKRFPGFWSGIALLITISIFLGWFILTTSRPRGCGQPEPCLEGATEASDSSIPVSSNVRDLEAISLGSHIEIAWKNVPPAVLRLQLFRAASPEGPWKLLFDQPAGALRGSFMDIESKTDVQPIYYQLAGRDERGRLVKEWPVLTVLPR